MVQEGPLTKKQQEEKEEREIQTLKKQLEEDNIPDSIFGKHVEETGHITEEERRYFRKEYAKLKQKKQQRRLQVNPDFLAELRTRSARDTALNTVCLSPGSNLLVSKINKKEGEKRRVSSKKRLIAGFQNHRLAEMNTKQTRAAHWASLYHKTQTNDSNTSMKKQQQKEEVQETKEQEQPKTQSLLSKAVSDTKEALSSLYLDEAKQRALKKVGTPVLIGNLLSKGKGMGKRRTLLSNQSVKIRTLLHSN